MDWQKVYKKNAELAAGYLCALLADEIGNGDWESPEAQKYGTEWTHADEMRWAWKQLQREMNHLDATTKEIPL